MARGPNRTVTRKDVLERIDPGVPETAGSIASGMDCHHDTVYNRLEELYEIDKVDTKETGSKSRVWWIPLPDDYTGVDYDSIDESEFISSRDPKIMRVLADASSTGEPMTSIEIAEAIGETRDVTYNRLVKMDERDHIDSFKTGATAKVWFLPDVTELANA